MARSNRLLLIVAVVTAALVLVQFVLISEESTTYFEGEETLQLEAVKKTPVFQHTTTLPVVLMHGMGDAAGNGGMMRIQKTIAEHLGVYVANVQLGDSVTEDVQNSFFVTMNNQTEMFAKIVREDPHLANGFNAAGFSQLIGEAVYTKRVQERIAQANYYRDPLRIYAFLKHAEFLPDLNNEKTSTNQTYKDNFAKLQNLVLVRANKDTQVFPKESEWFGMYRDGDPYKTVLGFNETRWYQEDLFGLKTLDKAGKVHFLSTDGDHLRFSIEFLLGVFVHFLNIYTAVQDKMASRDLVGRPLVPFFDSDDNVNDSLELAEGDDEREEMDVDARVWDKELGYFVYPSEQQGATISNRESRTDSGSKLLLTPSMMLSTSAPEHFNSMATNGNTVRASTDDAPARSSSAKRGSKQKSRSNTPGRRRKDKEEGEEASAASLESSKKGKSKGGNTNSSGNNQQSRNGKQKEQLSASGKWAWSAFQSSPDPAELPMPPFLTKPVGGISNGDSSPHVAKASAPPLPPTPPPIQHASVPFAPPLPPGPPPSHPPLPTTPPEGAASAQMSIELSMTQDLRRMLNIGGG
ncbi:hypothetical protein JG688_00006153 [Phytophthora aleatoria]|uniref:Palmitoyl-protein thioesterase 1 n=2 Tax=Phytophthora TaxID=4783 RepID=A0A8J5JBZ5_9STRA|nr:hypothetical protein JG688_00006153 [Phytophthora aleatoria]